MAYVGHSPVREFRDFRSASVTAAYATTFMKSAMLAIAAAATILALSEVGGSAGESVAAAKGDRVAAPVASATAPASFVVDAQSRTTTVERGAAMPLSPDSPFLGSR